MKSHALAEQSKVETMEYVTPEKVPFHAGFRKMVDMFPRMSGGSDIKMDISSHIETVALLTSDNV